MIDQPRPPSLAELAVHHVVSAHCAACQRGVRLDLDALAARYGAPTPAIALARRMRCTACGAIGAGLIVEARSRADPRDPTEPLQRPDPLERGR